MNKFFKIKQINDTEYIIYLYNTDIRNISNLGKMIKTINAKIKNGIIDLKDEISKITFSFDKNKLKNFSKKTLLTILILSIGANNILYAQNIPPSSINNNTIITSIQKSATITNKDNINNLKITLKKENFSFKAVSIEHNLINSAYFKIDNGKTKTNYFTKNLKQIQNLENKIEYNLNISQNLYQQIQKKIVENLNIYVNNQNKNFDKLNEKQKNIAKFIIIKTLTNATAVSYYNMMKMTKQPTNEKTLNDYIKNYLKKITYTISSSNKFNGYFEYTNDKFSVINIDIPGLFNANVLDKLENDTNLLNTMINILTVTATHENGHAQNIYLNNAFNKNYKSSLPETVAIVFQNKSLKNPIKNEKVWNLLKILHRTGNYDFRTYYKVSKKLESRIEFMKKNLENKKNLTIQEKLELKLLKNVKINAKNFVKSETIKLFTNQRSTSINNIPFGNYFEEFVISNVQKNNKITDFINTKPNNKMNNEISLMTSLNEIFNSERLNNINEIVDNKTLLHAHYILYILNNFENNLSKQEQNTLREILIKQIQQQIKEISASKFIKANAVFQTNLTTNYTQQQQHKMGI